MTTISTSKTNNSAETNRRLREEADAAVAPLIHELRGQGMSLEAIAKELSRRSIKTRQCFEIWHKRQVGRILERACDAEGD